MPQEHNVQEPPRILEMLAFEYFLDHPRPLWTINKYPQLKVLKNYLEKLSNIEFVRMTGSGSAFVAYFESGKKCKEAEKKVKKQFRNYWCKISKTI